MQGIYNILVTPLTKEGEVDETSLRNLVDFQISTGIEGLTIVAILGEGQKLTDSEWAQVVDVVIDQAKDRVPVIVTVTHQSTKIVVDRIKQATEAGAAGIMAAPPMNLKNLDAVGDFYRIVGEASSLPVVVQDEPATTGVIMPASFLANTGHSIIKLEEAPVPQKITRILQNNPDMKIFGGLGAQYFLEELDRGAVGTMTGFSMTEVLVSIYNDYVSGKKEQAAETFFKHIPLIRFEFQVGVGLAIRKEVLRRRGIIASAEIRSPGMRMDAQSQEELTRVLDLVGLSTSVA